MSEKIIIFCFFSAAILSGLNIIKDILSEMAIAKGMHPEKAKKIKRISGFVQFLKGETDKDKKEEESSNGWIPLPETIKSEDMGNESNSDADLPEVRKPKDWDY